MKTTFLYEKHCALGAKMAPFGGYMMPIQYKKGIVFEHNATRRQAAVFDTCHMGEFQFRGAGVVADLEHILSCPVESMKTGQCRYGYLCNEMGGVIDDQILYRRGEHDFFMVVNAATETSDFEWISAHITGPTIVENISSATAKIDLQGPQSPRICAQLVDGPIDELRYYHFMNATYHGERILLSRTGYTGEIGFEIYGAPECARQFWDECIAYGAEPAGLGARDTLRLEMGYPLYGHELDDVTLASWSGFTKAIGDKGFIGSESLGDTTYRLCALRCDGRRTVHRGDSVTDTHGVTIGRITSGSFSPSLGHAIALGYIMDAYQATGTEVAIITARGIVTGRITETPFYTNATSRDNIRMYLV